MESIQDQVIRKIRQLPPLPLAAQTLLTVADDERSSAEDLTRILKNDSALAAKVLQLVNSAFYGFPGKISTLSRAVVILGFSAIKNMAIGFATCEALKNLQGPVDWDNYWRHCLCAASCGQVVAQKAGYKVPEEVFIACLLHDVGFAVLSATLPAELRALDADGALGDVEREKATLGITHAEAGRLVMEHWKFPPALCQAARLHHTPSMLDTVSAGELLPLVVFADLYACLLGYGYRDRLMPFRYESLSARLGLKPEDTAGMFRDILARINVTRSVFGLPPESFDNHHRRVVLIGADRERSQWLQMLMSGWGFELLAESELQKQSPQSPDLCVLLDTSKLLPEPMMILERTLRERGYRVACIAGLQQAGEPEGRGRLAYLFTRPDLERQYW